MFVSVVFAGGIPIEVCYTAWGVVLVTVIGKARLCICSMSLVECSINSFSTAALENGTLKFHEHNGNELTAKWVVGEKKIKWEENLYSNNII